MKVSIHALAIALSGALAVSALAGCSNTGQPTATESTDDAAAATEEEAADTAQAVVEPAVADWSQINDSTVRAAIDAQLEKFYEANGERFGLLVVESLPSGDPFQAAGEAAFSLGMPAIVVATDQKDIQFVGDEALAYMADDRARMAKETAEYFDRGEFEQGIDHALGEIERVWQGG